MKILPFISTIDMLSYGNAMQVRTGQTLVAENISYHSYDPMMRLAFHQLRDPKAAVEEQGEDAVVPGLVGSVHTVQKFQAFFQIQVTWQRLFQPGGIQILHGVIRDQLGLVGEILVKRADSRNFSGS